MWSSKEATGNEKKKKSAEPEMGYCPFEHWLGRTRRLGEHGAHDVRARGWALGAGARAQGARRRGRSAQGALAAGGCWHGRRRAALGRAGHWGTRQQAHGCAEGARQQAHGRAERARHRPGRACARLGVLSWAKVGFLCTMT